MSLDTLEVLVPDIRGFFIPMNLVKEEVIRSSDVKGGYNYYFYEDCNYLGKGESIVTAWVAR